MTKLEKPAPKVESPYLTLEDLIDEPVPTVVGVIDITPEILKTPEGAAKVAKAMAEFEDATATVANESEAFLDSYSEEIAGMARGNNPEMIEAINDLNSAIENRRRKQEAFLRALAGR
jgi:hypothetical protein